MIACAAIILVMSNYLTKSADIVAIRTGIGRSFIGIVLLATATSLPELGTGVSSIAFWNSPDLAAGDAFGSNIFNLLIIALLDIYCRDKPILSGRTQSTAIIGTLGILIISISILGIITHSLGFRFSNLVISPISVLMFLFLLSSMYLIFTREKNHGSTGHRNQPDYSSISMTKTIVVYLISSVVVILAAVWLAKTGDALTHSMGWDATFIGTQFLALSTSLPELAASIAAVRINAPELALSNLLGSNLFNMGFILFVDDIALTSNTLWASISELHSITAIFAIMMTGVVVLCLLSKENRRLNRFLTLEALVLICLYLISSGIIFYLA